MDFIIRKTRKDDYFKTENITREAFWNLYKSGCDEHLVLNQLRKGNNYIPELDLVAISGNDIVGHIISTKAYILDDKGEKHEVLCVGPISVLPKMQMKGIGSVLIKHSIEKAIKLEYIAMVLFGAPEYYHKFGFKDAEFFNISTKEGRNFIHFMVLELEAYNLEGISGKFYEDEGFVTKNEDLDEFEKKFPEKEKGKPKIDLSCFM